MLRVVLWRWFMARKVGLALTALLLVAGALYFWVLQWQGNKPASYRTQALTRDDVSSKITATGSLQAVTSISVGSEVSGRVIALFVDYNSKVRKGQLLAQLDPSLFQAQVDQQTASLGDAQGAYDSALAGQDNAATSVSKATAAILGAQSQLESARSVVLNNRSSLLSAQADIAKGEAQLANSQRFSQRQKLLGQRDLIAKSDYDTAQSTFLQDRAALQSLRNQADGAQANLQAAESTVSARSADVRVAVLTRDGAVDQLAAARAQARSAGARVRQVRASLAQAEYTLSRSDLRSPIDGIVLNRKVTIGQTVAAQFQAPDLFTLAENLEQMQVEVAVDEADIGQVKAGAAATFTVDSFPEEKFTGRVSEVRQAPVTVQNVVTYTVIILTRNPRLQLMPGMTATVSIQVATHKAALLTSNAALRFRAPVAATPMSAGQSRATATLYTVAGQDLQAHSVRLGISDGIFTELLDTDLKAGDQVVLESTGTGNTTTQVKAATGRPGPPMF